MNTTPPGHPELDLERLAAYLDGELDAEERASVEAVLARSEAAREVLAEAVRLRRDVDEVEIVELPVGDADASSSAGASTSASRRRWRWAVPLAAAAVLALLLPILRTGGAPTTVELAHRIAAGASGLVQGGWDAQGWTEVRGATATLAPQELAVRAGARWMEALVALESGEAREADRIFQEVQGLVAGVPLSAPAVALLAELSGRGDVPPEPEEVARAEETLSELLPGSWFQAGRSLEALRLAAASGSAEALADQALVESLLESIREAVTTPEGRTRLDTLEEALAPGGGGAASEAVAAAAGELLAVLAG